MSEEHTGRHSSRRMIIDKLAPTERTHLLIGAVILVFSALLLFSSLGHYALWDDETETALGAEGVLLSGDTTSILGQNLVARRAGITVHNLHDRFTPPVPTYLVAASMALFGKAAFAARLPFALMGVATVFLILCLLRKFRASTLVWILTGIAILGNVSLFLYFRQARYYGAVLFFSVLIAYVYLTWAGRRRQALLISLASAALFFSHQICYLEVNTILFVDYILFRRKFIPLRDLRLPWLILPQLILIATFSMVWNPFLTKAEEYLKAITLSDRLVLFWWNLRDLNQAEFGVGLLLVFAVATAIYKRNFWILRGLVAILLAVLVASATSHQTISVTAFADVRYIIPVIPICIAVGVMTIDSLAGSLPWLAIVIAIVSFWTNAFHGALLTPGKLRSTLADYVGELRNPPTEPYTPAAQWVAKNISEGSSVWVVPEHMMYPLMFHAPNAVYAWQLQRDNKEPQFAKLNRIHFQGEIPPDYIIVFGPYVIDIAKALNQWKTQGAVYELDATLDTHWKDLYRPELFWRTFKPITDYNKQVETINIFRLKKNH